MNVPTFSFAEYEGKNHIYYYVFSLDVGLHMYDKKCVTDGRSY